MYVIKHDTTAAMKNRDKGQEIKSRVSHDPSKGRKLRGAYHVIPAKKGGWAVRTAGAHRATEYFETKAEAVARGKEISRTLGTEFVVHARDGRIRKAIKRDQLRTPDVKAQKTERIEIRTTSGMKALLQRAASFSHKNVTEFLLEAGINAAEETLVDRRMFRLDQAQWQAFQEILDSPVTARPRLAKLLAEKSVLE